jgi:hypothetical protein
MSLFGKKKTNKSSKKTTASQKRNGQIAKAEKQNAKAKDQELKAEKKPSVNNSATANGNGHYQRHFRRFHSIKTTGHPTYVYGEKGKDYEIVQITHSEKTKGKDNIPLDNNPEPKSTKKAYLRPNSTTIRKGVKNEKLKGWKFSDSDKKKVQAVIDKKKTKK